MLEYRARFRGAHGCSGSLFMACGLHTLRWIKPSSQRTSSALITVMLWQRGFNVQVLRQQPKSISIRS